MTDSAKDNKLVVRNILKGSVAEKAGIKEGDVIVSVNDQPVSSYAEWATTVKSGVPYDMEVLRQGRELIRVRMEVAPQPSELKGEADYAKVIEQIERATGDKKVFNN